MKMSFLADSPRPPADPPIHTGYRAPQISHLFPKGDMLTTDHCLLHPKVLLLELGNGHPGAPLSLGSQKLATYTPLQGEDFFSFLLSFPPRSENRQGTLTRGKQRFSFYKFGSAFPLSLPPDISFGRNFIPRRPFVRHCCMRGREFECKMLQVDGREKSQALALAVACEVGL